MAILKGALLYLHLVIASGLVFYMHIFVPVVLPDAFSRFIYPFGGLYFQLSPLLSIFVGFGASYLYFKLFRVERPAKRALISTIIGTVLFWSSCLALMCALAPALRNM
ncbi:hypothetical protein [Hydrogenivirga sp.]